MTKRSELIIARMRERTLAMKPAQTEPVEEPGEEARLPVQVSNREKMRPTGLRCTDRKCDVRGGYKRIVFDYVRNGIEITTVVRKVRGRRGAKKPRYKTDHTKRRI